MDKKVVMRNNNYNEYIRITSKNNNGVVEAFKLNEKKYREEYGRYIAEGKKLLEKVEGTEAFWILADGSVHYTKNMEKLLQSKGATNK